jgi:hypothetical protein
MFIKELASILISISFFSLVPKMFIYLYLDSVNDYRVSINPINFIKYFVLPNDIKVSERYLRLKKACNLLHKVFIYTLFMGIVLLITWNFVK